MESKFLETSLGDIVLIDLSQDNVQRRYSNFLLHIFFPEVVRSKYDIYFSNASQRITNPPSQWEKKIVHFNLSKWTRRQDEHK